MTSTIGTTGRLRNADPIGGTIALNSCRANTPTPAARAAMAAARNGRCG
jgi:hypothetical protein